MKELSTTVFIEQPLSTPDQLNINSWRKKTASGMARSNRVVELHSCSVFLLLLKYGTNLPLGQQKAQYRDINHPVQGEINKDKLKREAVLSLKKARRITSLGLSLLTEQ